MHDKMAFYSLLIAFLLGNYALTYNDAAQASY